ncbi:hypothetical protein GCM10027046_30580 [Uliginosibacterium flavum]|uniref:Uncharacterized protein n=1 Tax=Uliginosibacterium flavum TaxID=1396831 RepID=A0ABV2TG80_9RHOO
MHELQRIRLVEMAGEGGGVDLSIEITPFGTIGFRVSKQSDAAYFEELLGEDFSAERVAADSPLLADWDSALQALDQMSAYWPMLAPVFLHSSVRERVLQVLKERAAECPEARMGDWWAAPSEESAFGGESFKSGPWDKRQAFKEA